MRAILLFLAFITFYHTVWCRQNEPAEISRLQHLIPRPQQVIESKGRFIIHDKTSIYIDLYNDTLLNLANELADFIGLDHRLIKFHPHHKKLAAGNILLQLTPDISVGNEGYRLRITSSNIMVTANSAAGIFYALQTIKQLLPEVHHQVTKNASLSIEACDIIDQPRFSYRGSMLDVARHFFSVGDVKRYIDLISLYKMNMLHLGLTNDQGWRIEIKSWPKLTSIGGSSSVDGNRPGFYTQEQYKDIVAYAQQKFVTVIPEIDMPGHTNAALASYAQLNCNDTATALYTGIKVGFSSLCIHKEITYQFVDDVVREITAITPGPWIHIGGDESHATKKDDYLYFIERATGIVQQHGKNVIGWEEIGAAKLPANSIAEYWARDSSALAAAKKGAKIIMAPSTRAYLDMQYDSTTKLGLHWAGYVEVDKAYSWDPANHIKGLHAENIIGVEAPLWSETLTSFDDITYMAFPRIIGIAEIGWTKNANKDWNEYKLRLANHARNMEALRIHFYRSSLVPWVR